MTEQQIADSKARIKLAHQVMCEATADTVKLVELIANKFGEHSSVDDIIQALRRSPIDSEAYKLARDYMRMCFVISASYMSQVMESITLLEAGVLDPNDEKLAAIQAKHASEQAIKNIVDNL
jgi:hypothetical protein